MEESRLSLDHHIPHVRRGAPYQGYKLRAVIDPLAYPFTSSPCLCLRPDLPCRAKLSSRHRVAVACHGAQARQRYRSMAARCLGRAASASGVRRVINGTVMF